MVKKKNIGSGKSSKRKNIHISQNTPTNNEERIIKDLGYIASRVKKIKRK